MLTENENLEYCKIALNLKGKIEVDFLLLGKYLYKIRENQLYEPQWSSWLEFCMEFKGMSNGTISKIISVYEKFVLEFQFSQGKLAKAGGWTILYDLIPLCETKTKAEKWIESAETLTRSDIKKEIMEIKTGIQMKECGHKDTYTIQICRDCGERISVDNSHGS